jgi:electron transfer flavoprotein beta subunit
MKMVVCVKHVPDVTNVQVDPKTGTLVREGVRSILNPFCEYALDQAVHLAEQYKDVEIIAVTMGPPQARDALMRCLELGADRGILVTDRKFAGADTWATAYTLAEVIRRYVPDFKLILAGKQAIDGDTAQVGPEIAEILNLPQITYGTTVTFSSSLRQVRVRQEVEQGYEVLECNLPALVTISRGDMVRRAPSLDSLLAACNKPITVVKAEDLGLAESSLGLQGSYTQVVKVFPPATRQANRLVSGLEAGEAAREIYDYLKEQHFLDKGGN